MILRLMYPVHKNRMKYSLNKHVFLIIDYCNKGNQECLVNVNN